MLETPITIAHAIQLAVAPVFLLTGISAMLVVFSGRMTRLSDRARALFAAPPDDPSRGNWAVQLGELKRRSGLLNWATTLGTIAALFISLVIAVIFVGFVLGTQTALVVAGLFVAATLIFSFSLLLFLREVHIGSRSLTLCEVGESPDASGGCVQSVPEPVRDSP